MVRIEKPIRINRIIYKKSHSIVQAFRMGSTVDILRMTVCLSTVVIYLIVLCLFGYEVTLRFDEIDEAVYLCSWTEFPSQIQKLWPLIMNITQNPIYIHGYFNDQCTREFLKKVSCQRKKSYF